MKPFNLEEAKAGKPVQTKAGKPVRIICFDKVSTDFRPIVALVTCKDDSGEFEMLIHAATDGTVLYGNMYDLCMVPLKREGFINIWPGACGSTIYFTEEQAKAQAAPGVVATAHIEWEE